VIVPRMRTTFVPPYMNDLGFSSPSSFHFTKSSSLTGILLTGTLSPVSMLSFTIASPDSKKRSDGTKLKDDIERLTTSPGTRSRESFSSPRSVVRSQYHKNTNTLTAPIN
jgi:hypothetical protein